MNDEALNKAKKLLSLLEGFNTPLHQVRYVAQDLNELKIVYCVIGGVALSPHNYIRHTEDIDILVAKRDVPKLKGLIGCGYTYRPGSKKNMYFHTSAGGRIPIDILYEGDNKDGFVMPNPKSIRTKIGGVWYISLVKVIDMKLTTARPGDLQDVLQLIWYNELGPDFADQLPLSTRSEFRHYLKEMEKR